MNRRTFLRSLLLAPFAKPIADVISKHITEPKKFNPWVSHWAKYCVGYRGDQFLDSGYIYSPYIPLQTTDDKFIKAYASKTLNKDYYGKFVINV